MPGPKRGVRAGPATALDRHECGARKATGGVEGNETRWAGVPRQGAVVLARLPDRLGEVGRPLARAPRAPVTMPSETRVGRRKMYGVEKTATRYIHSPRVDLKRPTAREARRRAETGAEVQTYEPAPLGPRMARPVPDKGALEAETDGNPVHAKVEARPYIGAAVPLGPGPLEVPFDIEGQFPVRVGLPAGAFMVKRALQGVHQAARTVGRHHPTRDRVS